MHTRAATWVAFGAAVVLGFALACVVDLPPDGKYACTSDGDCGGGDWRCTPATGGPRYCCKPSGTEVCDGKDNDCDGVTDDIATDQPCYTGTPGTEGVGECHGGMQACADGGTICAGEVVPTAESCNGKDDDCNTVIDNGFNLGTDRNNCGVCGRGCSAQQQCEDGGCAFPTETNCRDGIDNDGDRTTDCADNDCANQECSPDGGCTCRNFGKTEAACSDGLDNDTDGPIDCADSDCAGLSCNADGGCICQGGAKFENLCNDTIDNDNDGPADCADSDCAGQSCNADGGCICQGGGKFENACNDSLDNDGDGPIDCMDNDCDGGSCGSGCTCRQGGKTESNCTDRQDNDGDLTVDKCDLDCSTTGCGNGCTCDGGVGTT